jgi:hypothetical protein
VILTLSWHRSDDIRVNRRAAGTVAKRPLKLGRIADFITKCSNIVRQSPDALLNNA